MASVITKSLKHDKIRIALIFTVLTTLLITTVAQARTIEGNWKRAKSDGGTLMKVTKCGGSYCVYVGSGPHAGELTGKLKRNDDRNYVGTLTDLRDGNRYTGKANLSSTGRKLKVSGCVLKIICVGETWSRP